MTDSEHLAWWAAAPLLLLASCQVDSSVGSNCPDGGCIEQSSTLQNTDAGRDGIEKVDVLFVIDDSRSMVEEQALLREEMPRFVRVLVSGDRNENGTQDFRPPRSLHLGVVTSNLGVPGSEGIPGCSEAGHGDDGVLVDRPRDDSADIQARCEHSYSPYLEASDEDDPQDVAADLSCLASVGVRGCGFEQPLEAGLKAVATEEDEVRFYGDTTGHGSGVNAGFLREDSLLVVVVISDEDDCSSHTTEHFEIDAADRKSLNTRCQMFPENLYAVERYVRELENLRAGGAGRVIFSAITGVPTDLVDPDFPNSLTYRTPDEVDAYYDELLGDSRMQVEIVDADDVQKKVGEACNSEHGSATPARRIVEVARGFGRNGVVQSICEKDFRPPMDGIMHTIARRLGPPDEAITTR